MLRRFSNKNLMEVILCYMVIWLLQERTASPSAYTRATMVIAIKYTIVERPQPIDSHIKSCIATFLLLIKDEDRVRDSCFHLAEIELHSNFHSKVHWLSAGHKYLITLIIFHKDLQHEYSLILYHDQGFWNSWFLFECLDCSLCS